MKHTAKTHNICARGIEYEIDDAGLVRNVHFLGGCLGNSRGIAALADGLTPNELIKKLKGIQCRYGTSCPDQLAKALEAQN